MFLVCMGIFPQVASMKRAPWDATDERYERTGRAFPLAIKKGDITVALFPSCSKPYAALNILCGSITNFFGTPASNSP